MRRKALAPCPSQQVRNSSRPHKAWAGGGRLRRVAKAGAGTASALFAALLLLALFPAPPSRGASDYPRRPKLVLILVIDQFRYDYLVRFRQAFGEGGFNRLLKGGANYANCRYDYATTETGPGHASLFTGAYGNLHGIISNSWYDREHHQPMYCVEDPTTRIVGEPAGAVLPMSVSPRNLLGSTLGDELRVASNFQSRVVAISLKDRSAILPGGHTANAAYWYDPATGHFITSTYYMQALPAWVEEFNAAGPTKAYCGKPWEALKETPGIGGEVLAPAPAANNAPCPNPNFRAWMMETPFMNEVELNFAEAAVENERLGQGPATDLLALSLSINDYIGHEFGPYSPQVADTTVRTDRYLAAFFADLDKKLGLANVWIALSADHGVAPSPHYIMEHHLGPGLIYTQSAADAVQQALTRAFGEANWIDFAFSAWIYLNHAALASRGADLARAQNLAAEAAASVPGIQAAFTQTQFLTGTLTDSPLARKAAHSFNSMRAGDLFLVPVPYAVPSDSTTGTTHGSPWNYDAQVPMVLWGSPFKPGVYTLPCQPIDLAPTLAALLGLTQPSDAQGTTLTDSIK